MVKEGILAVLMLGDLNFTGIQFLSTLQKNQYDPSFPFKNTEQTIKKSDLVIANMEGPFTFSEWSKESEGKKWRFRQLPAFAKAIKEAGIGVLLLANNHIADAGTPSVSM